MTTKSAYTTHSLRTGKPRILLGTHPRRKLLQHWGFKVSPLRVRVVDQQTQGGRKKVTWRIKNRKAWTGCQLYRFRWKLGWGCYLWHSFNLEQSKASMDKLRNTRTSAEMACKEWNYLRYLSKYNYSGTCSVALMLVSEEKSAGTASAAAACCIVTGLNQ